MKRSVFIFIFLLPLAEDLKGQALGLNQPTPDASSILDMVATNRGVLVPRVALTATTAVGAPVVCTASSDALLVYNTATAGDVTPGYYYYNHATLAWIRFVTGSGTTRWDQITNPAANLNLTHGTNITTMGFSNTTTDAFTMNANSLTSGKILTLSSTSTAGAASSSTTLLNLVRSGANAGDTHVAYGLYSSVTNTGTTNVNIGGYFGVGGASTSNTAIYVGAITSTGATNSYGILTGASTGTGASADHINLGTITGANTTSHSAITAGAISGATPNAYGINLGTITGGTTANTGVNIGAITSTGATNSYGINIGTSSGTGASADHITLGTITGANTTSHSAITAGAISGATPNAYGINLGTITGGTTANTGVNIGAITSTGATNSYGINIGTSSGTGATADHINLGTITGANTTSHSAITAGAISGATGNAYGINLGTLTGGATANTGINMGAITSTGATNSYGINLGTTSGTGTTTYGINIGANTSSGTTNTGLYVGAVSGATNNYAAIFAGGRVGIGTTAPDASSSLDITSTSTGLLIPRVALTATNAVGPVAAPVDALLVYNTATAGGAGVNVTPGFYYYNTATTAWIRIFSGGGAPGVRWDQLVNPTANLALTHGTNTTTMDFANTTTSALALTNSALTTGTGFSVSSTNAAATGNSFINSSNSTGLSVAGIARFNFTGAHTGNGLQIDDATVTGKATALTAAAITTGQGLHITAGGATALTTGNALLVTGPSGAAALSGAAGGIVNFTTAGNYTSANDAGLLNLNATATTGGIIQNILGTAMTTGTLLKISGTATTTGKAIDVLGNVNILQNVKTTAASTPSALIVTNAANTTAYTASTEANAVKFDFSPTVTIAAGALTNQASMLISPGTFAFGGATTVTNPATVRIGGAPTAGANATFTYPGIALDVRGTMIGALPCMDACLIQDDIFEATDQAQLGDDYSSLVVISSPSTGDVYVKINDAFAANFTSQGANTDYNATNWVSIGKPTGGATPYIMDISVTVVQTDDEADEHAGLIVVRTSDGKVYMSATTNDAQTTAALGTDGGWKPFSEINTNITGGTAPTIPTVGGM